MAARTPCFRRCSTRSTISPSQQGVEGTDLRSGLDDHRRISDTGHVYLLIGKDLYPSFIRRHILYPLATSSISLRNSWALFIQNSFWQDEDSPTHRQIQLR